MSREKVIMTGVAGAGILGAIIYAIRGNSSKSKENRNKAQQKRDLGLGGAGIGGNHAAGGNERGSSPGKGDQDLKRQVTTAKSRDQLPSGYIGGGEGAGGSSARDTQIPFTGSEASGMSGSGTSGNSKAATRSEPSNKSGWPSFLKSPIGGKSNASRRDMEQQHDTRGISKTGSETPSKRGPVDTSD